MLAAATGEIVGCYRCDANDPVECNGMIPVLLVRKGPQGMLAIASFLVDFWCLGVKDCFYYLDSPDSINTTVKDMDKRLGLTSIKPSAARAMVELGVGMADTLGFAPHADYRTAMMLWGDVELGELPSDIEFGVDGKPRYLVGPNDSQARQFEILSQLLQSVGEGNFDFFVGDHPFMAANRFSD